MGSPRRTCLSLALLVALLAAAAAAEPRISTSTSRTAVTVGDTITYRVRVVAAESSNVVMPHLSTRIGDFEVLGHRRGAPRAIGGGRAVWADDYLLAVYAPGEHAIPPTPVFVIGSPGDTINLTCDTTRVLVESVLGAGDEGLRDIKGPATVPKRGILRALVLGAVGAIAVLCVALILRRRRRIALGAAAAAAPPPHVAALDRLERLLAAGLLESGELKEYYVELSEALRTYLDQRYLIPAPEMTTAELSQRLKYLGLPPDLRSETCDLLAESDMVKFAKYRPELETAFMAAARAKGIIERSAPVEPPPESIAS